MLNRSTRYLLAAIQALIAWEWLASGLNKVLAGDFPQTLADTLRDGINGNPNLWYVSFLQANVLPHSVFFGYFIEWAELAVGVLFVIGAIMLLRRQRMHGEPQYRLMIGVYSMAVVASLLCVFFCVNFHFWQGKGMLPGFHGSPGDEGVDLDALIAPFSLVVAIAYFALIAELRGSKWYLKIQKTFDRGNERDLDKTTSSQTGQA